MAGRDLLAALRGVFREELALALRELRWDDDVHEHVEIALRPGPSEMRLLLSTNGLLLLLFGIAPAMLMNVCFEVIKAL